MYIMYVDESGDAGLIRSPTTHFSLSGIVIHESKWREFIDKMKSFRKAMRAAHGLPIRSEIHASAYLRHAPISGMLKHTRLAILRNLLDELAKMDFISITNVVVKKIGKPNGYDVFENAWKVLFQRFENTLTYGNFPGGHRSDFGIVITDATDGEKLTRLVRRMSVFNFIPSRIGGESSARNIPILRIIEDPSPKDSKNSHFIQACDTCAYFALQKFCANSYIRKRGAQNHFDRLEPVLNKKANYSNNFGIVIL